MALPVPVWAYILTGFYAALVVVAFFGYLIAKQKFHRKVGDNSNAIPIGENSAIPAAGEIPNPNEAKF